MKIARVVTLFIVALITATSAFAQHNVQKIDALMKQYSDKANITFEKDSSGKVIGLVLSQGSRTANAKKIK